LVSSPPRDATTTMVESSWYGDVSIVMRGRPLFLPFVVNSITGIPLNRQPSRPPDALRSTRWNRFMDLRTKSEGMCEKHNGGPMRYAWLVTP
jgi:hypothetical protein